MIPTDKKYFVCPDCIDGRKSFNGLTGIVRSELQRDPAGGDVFIFVSRSRQSIKLLFWEHGGFVIYYKTAKYLKRKKQEHSGKLGQFDRTTFKQSGERVFPATVILK